MEKVKTLCNYRRPMLDYIFVTPEGFDLSHYLDLCLTFNPLAKASKPKKKKQALPN